ncbi:sugar phosphate isomerase [Streptomyces populi]|uniref:Sugar phosphate isomerase n=1 Tax=Streptomyces populi TaxID=2058924 RepID=A0A2I0SN84_9ACTN|nr:EboA domain-containing protein [Streptomyces populi]PKT71360.1 sugar phosphate isomerase [Streptomyces populi]
MTPTPVPATPEALAVLRTALDTRLTGPARAWLDDALVDVRAETAPAGRTPPAAASTRTATPAGAAASTRSTVPAWELRFAAAGRHCGHEHADAVRVLLLTEARPGPETLARLYHQGSAAERRAVLHALPHLVDGPEGLPLVADALRTNDTGLVAAALGPYAAAHLDQHSWRHAVLKCLFTQVPVAVVAGLGHRAHGDATLARMLADHAAERTAAGRDVPHDLHRVLALTAQARP